jgi:hypothetical protein
VTLASMTARTSIWRNRQVALAAIKAIHTVAFVVIAASGLLVLFDGLVGRPRQRTGVAAGIALTECAIYAGNGFVCPLTPLAERLGARKGSVSDIFLPDWFAQRLPIIGSTVLLTGLALNVRVLVGEGSRSVRP